MTTENTISVSTLDETGLSNFLSHITEQQPYFTKNTKTKIAALKRSLDVAESIRRLTPSTVDERSITNAVQNLNALQIFVAQNVQDLNSILEARNSPRKQRAEETIRSLARKMTVTFDGPYAIIESGPVTIRHNGMKHEMGEFTIKMRAVYDRIIIIGTKPRDGVYHPHVSSSGSPCFGNIKELVNRLSKDCEFEELAFILLDFIKSYSEDNPYRNIAHWRDGYCSNCFELRTFCECGGEHETEEEEEEEDYDDYDDDYEDESDDF